MKILGRKKQNECYEKLSRIRKSMGTLLKLCDAFTEEADEAFLKAADDTTSLINELCGIKGLDKLLSEIMIEMDEHI